MRFRIARVVWVTFASLFTLWGIIQGGDANIITIAALAILSAPMGLIVYYLLPLLASTFFNLSAGQGYFLDVLIYITTVALGYIQWFVVVPRICDRFSERGKVGRN